MPRVPIYDAPQVDERALPAPTTNVQPGSPLGLISEGLGQLSQGTERFAAAVAQAKQKADATAAIEARRAFDVKVNERLTSIVTQKGKAAAVSAYGENDETNYEYELAKLREQMQYKLANDEQRRLFRQETDLLLDNTKATVERHVANQNREAMEATATAELNDSLNRVGMLVQTGGLDAILTAPPGKPNALLTNMALAERSAQVLSLSPEAAAQKVKDYRAAMAKTVLQSLVARQEIPKARELLNGIFYFDSKGEPVGMAEVLGDDFAKAKEMVEQGGKVYDVNRAISQIAAASSNQDSGLIDEPKALALAYAISDDNPNKREIITGTLQLINHSQTSGKLKVDKLLNDAFAVLRETGSISNKEMQPIRLQLLAPEARSVGGAEAWNKVQLQWEMTVRENKKADVETRQTQERRNRDALTDFRGAPRHERINWNIPAVYGGSGLDEVGLDMLREQQEKDIRNEQANPSRVKRSGYNERVNRMASAIEGEIGGSDGKKAAARFRSNINNWFDNYESANKEQPPPEEIDKQFNYWRDDVFRESLWGEIKKKRYELKPSQLESSDWKTKEGVPVNKPPAEIAEEAERAKLSKMDPTKVDAIRNRIRGTNGKVRETNANIIRLYEQIYGEIK
jgi:hypothetical protein